MAATIKFELKTEPREDGARLIMLRITLNRKHARLGTKQWVLPANWNAKGSDKRENWVSKKADDAIIINTDLRNKYRRAQAVLVGLAEAGQDDDLARIKAAVAAAWAGKAKDSEKKAALTFGQLMTLYADNDRQPSRSASLAIRALLHNEHLTDFMALPMANVNRAAAEAMAKRLLGCYSVVTARRRLATIRSVYQFGIGRGLISGDNPFRSLKMPVAKVMKNRLTREQVMAIEQLTGLAGRLLDARDTFVFQYYANGARVGDILLLRWSNVNSDRITYLAQKDGKPRSARILPQMEAILNRLRPLTWNDRFDSWVFPWLEPGLRAELPRQQAKKYLGGPVAVVNKNLKKIGQLIGLKVPLTSHMARHSLADHLLAGDVDVNIIKTVLGHTSLTVTEAYLSQLSQQRYDDAVAAVIAGGKKTPGETEV